jgi:hypothetical protein
MSFSVKTSKEYDYLESADEPIYNARKIHGRDIIDSQPSDGNALCWDENIAKWIYFDQAMNVIPTGCTGYTGYTGCTGYTGYTGCTGNTGYTG